MCTEIRGGYDSSSQEKHATGTVDLTTSPTTALITFSNMAPGDKVTNPITVNNPGSLQFRYAVTSTTTENVLAAQIDLTIKSGVTTCTNAAFGTDGTVVRAAGDLATTAGINLIGDPTTGLQAGDRTLVATTGTEVLCFQAELPIGTGNTFQGLTTTATLTFAAEQTVNN
ncbi:MAG: TasA family protein [Dehalococcoidia bacterium]|nr:TasA family protein [Dehalococcoidia bacterium]